MPYHLAPGVTHCTANGPICDKCNIFKYNIFHRPDEVMLFAMVKACLCSKNVMLFRTIKEFIIIYCYLCKRDGLSTVFGKNRTEMNGYASVIVQRYVIYINVIN